MPIVLDPLKGGAQESSVYQRRRTRKKDAGKHKKHQNHKKNKEAAQSDGNRSTKRSRAGKMQTQA